MNGDKESSWESLARLIPGYGAYRSQEDRREDDRRTRQFLVQRLQECKVSLERLGAGAVQAGDLETPLIIDRCAGRIDTAQSRLSAAVEGYAGWFNERTVDEALLKRIHEHDNHLVSLVDRIDGLIKAWGNRRAEPPSELNEAIDLLHARIDRRAELLHQSG